MDIKDEINAMLYGLKSGTNNEQKPKSNVENTVPAKSAPQRKSVYDNMSVDELLTALTDENKPSAQVDKPDVHEVKPSSTEKKHSKSITQNHDIPKNLLDMLSTSTGKTLSDSTARNKTSVSESVNITKALEPQPVAQNVKTKNEMPKTEKTEIKKKRIIIKEELPDYEALRKQELEKLAEQEIAAAEREAQRLEQLSSSQRNVIMPSENEPEESLQAEADILTDSINQEPLENPINTENIEEEEEIKPSLFSKLKGIFSKSEAESSQEDDIVDDETSEEEISDELIPQSLDDENEYDNSSDIPVNESEEKAPKKEEAVLSAAELVDAAIAAIEEVQLDNYNDEVSKNPTPVLNEKETEEKIDEEDPVNELISDMREDAAAAMAEIDNGEQITDDADSDSSVDTNEQSEETNEPQELNIDVSVGNAKKKGRITAALEKILDEDPDEIIDERSEKAEDDEIDVRLRKNNSGKIKKRIYAFMGVIFTILAIIGLITVVSHSILYFRNFTAGESKKDSFSDIIYPAVIMDIASFTNPSELTSDQIISAALWSLVMSSDDMEKYEKTFDVISVPAIDIEAYAAKLFGDELPELTHATVGSGELKFYYNEETKSYNVPVNPITFTYKPEIKSVSKNDNEYTLVVDYIKELPAWMTENENFTQKISKTVEFKLTEKNDSYVISSMEIKSITNAL